MEYLKMESAWKYIVKIYHKKLSNNRKHQSDITNIIMYYVITNIILYVISNIIRL